MKREIPENLSLAELLELLMEHTFDLLNSLQNRGTDPQILYQKKETVERIQEMIRKKKCTQ